ncbi:MAG: TIGR02594 family protein, partial [Desulfobaccales bacterium]
VVQPGDTLSEIAAAYDLSWQEIWEANKAKIPNPDLIRPGDELLIPGAAPSGAPEETPPEPSPQTTVYTVKAGDTLPQIAQDHGLSLARLLELNPNLLQAGMQLLVPAPATAGPAAAAGPTPPSAAPGPAPAGDAAPAWLLIARQEVGVHENSAPGQDNPRILEYLESTTYDGGLTDEVPWCSAFVNWCVTKAGLKGTNSAAASSWLTWGQKLDQPRLGCITVFNHHVGFYAGSAGDHFLLLGGNQSNAVNTEHKDPSDVLAYRWPAAA